jgi:Flp pilus assembly protein TadB
MNEWLGTFLGWLGSQNPVNMILAFLTGAGIFALTMGILQREQVNLLEIDRTYSGGRTARSWRERLQVRLDDAGVNLRVREFMTTMVLVVLGGGVGLFVISGLVAGLVMGGVVAGSLYWGWLQRRAEKNRQVYESELPKVVARLISGASAGNTWLAAAEHASQFGPTICRDDWRYVVEQTRLNVPPEQIFKALSEKRKNVLLNLILELLLLTVKEGLPVTQTLPLIKTSLQERQRMMDSVRTMVTNKLRNMAFVCASPFVMVIGFSYVSPMMAEVYTRPISQVLVGTGWALTLVFYWYASRWFTNAVRGLTDYDAVLNPLDRSRLTTGPAPEAERQMPAPGALAEGATR